jgi:hypothetical protein
MVENFEEIPIQQEKPLKQLFSEREYIEMCTKESIGGGYLEESDRDMLITRYLKPLYQAAQEILEEVDENTSVESEPDFAPYRNRIVRNLRSCLSATTRIGVTDPNNILRSIREYGTLPFHTEGRSGEEEYAMEAFLIKAIEIISQ